MTEVQTQYIPPSPVTVGTFSVTGNDSTVQFTHTIPAGYTYSMYQIQDSQTGWAETTDITVECWAYLDSNQTGRCFVSNYSDIQGWVLGVSDGSTNKVKWFTAKSGSSTTATSSTTLSNTTWYHVVGTFTGTTTQIYINAATDGSAGSFTGPISYQASARARIGSLEGNRQTVTGRVDEVRISNVARSANYITTCYNNQSAPGTFYAIGTEVTVSSTANGNFLMFM